MVSFRKRPSSLAPVVRIAKKRAGSTFVSFRTRQSEGSRKSAIFLKWVSVRALFWRFRTRSLESVRVGAGCWAIRAGGRS